MKNTYNVINLVILAILVVLFMLKIYNLWIYIILIIAGLFVSIQKYKGTNNYRNDIIFKAIGLIAISIAYWFYTNKQ